MFHLPLFYTNHEGIIKQVCCNFFLNFIVESIENTVKIVMKWNQKILSDFSSKYFWEFISAKKIMENCLKLQLKVYNFGQTIWIFNDSDDRVQMKLNIDHFEWSAESIIFNQNSEKLDLAQHPVMIATASVFICVFT